MHPRVLRLRWSRRFRPQPPALRCGCRWRGGLICAREYGGELVAGDAHWCAVELFYAEFVGECEIVAGCPREGQFFGCEVIGEVRDGATDLLDCVHDDRDDRAVVYAGDRAARVVGREVRIDCRRIFGNEAVTHGARSVIVVDEGDGLQ